MGKVIPFQKIKARDALVRERARLEARWFELTEERARIQLELENVGVTLMAINREVLALEKEAARRKKSERAGEE